MTLLTSVGGARTVKDKLERMTTRLSGRAIRNEQTSDDDTHQRRAWHFDGAWVC
jgi:hypothetical protein